MAALLKAEGFSLQGTSRTTEGARHPDRDAQFRSINDQVTAYLAEGRPVIGVDAKKKETLGNYAVIGREWHRAGQPVQVRAHDFPERGAQKAVPYGIYDIGADAERAFPFVSLVPAHTLDELADRARRSDDFAPFEASDADYGR